MTSVSVALIIFNNLAEPLESRFARNMENFNEMISLCIIYLMMAMSDGNPDVHSRQIYGKCFIGVVCVYLGVHMPVLLVDVCSKIKLKLKSKFACLRNKDPVEEKKKQDKMKRDLELSKKRARGAQARL